MTILYILADIQIKREFGYLDNCHHGGGGFPRCPGDMDGYPGYRPEAPPVAAPLPTYQRRGSLQLWQFLVALLDDPANATFIAWTGRGLEFKLIEPEEVSFFSFSILCILLIYIFCVPIYKNASLYFFNRAFFLRCW